MLEPACCFCETGLAARSSYSDSPGGGGIGTGTGNPGGGGGGGGGKGRIGGGGGMKIGGGGGTKMGGVSGASRRSGFSAMGVTPRDAVSLAYFFPLTLAALAAPLTTAANVAAVVPRAPVFHLGNAKALCPLYVT